MKYDGILSKIGKSKTYVNIITHKDGNKLGRRKRNINYISKLNRVLGGYR